MKSLYKILLPVLGLLCMAELLPAQAMLCNTNGNLVMYANYDGGVLNINCDVNIPNLKIGICTYEPVTINITGPFAGNVTEVRYAGYVSTNNFHCNNSPATTTITGVPSNITSVNFLPPATLSNPNGNNSIVCAYQCGTTSSQGGCNTSDQVVDYFQTTMNATMRSYFTQYGCWSTTAYAVSGGGNCCPNVAPPCTITADAGPDLNICNGGSAQINATTMGGVTYSWSPSAGLSCTNCLNPTASPSTTTNYILTVSDSSNCMSIDTVTVTVNNGPQATTSPFNPVCASAPAFTLTGGMPANGNWSGPGVAGNVFDPAVAGPGTHSLVYTVVDFFGCPGTSSQQIIVTGPMVALAPFSSVCETDSAFLLTGGSPPGGVYSGMGVSNGVFDPASAGPGMISIVYSVTDSNNCTATATSSLMVTSTPAVPGIQQVGSDSLYASIPADSFSWFLNNIQISGNTQGIQTTQNGSYTVIAWVNGCPSLVSAGYPFEFVSIASALGSEWSVYPNPVTASAHSYISIVGPVSSYEFSIFDLAGKQLANGMATSQKTNVNLTLLPAGSYLLEIRSDPMAIGLERQFVRIVVQ